MELIGPRLEEVARFTVLGQPIGQGQVSFLGKGRPAVHKNRKTLYPWRDEIGRAFARHLVETGLLSPWVALSGAVAVDRWYTMPRPAAKASWRPWPTVNSAVNSDIDHLDRAVFDSLKLCGAIEDDALVVGGAHWKAYPGTYPMCPPGPGVTLVLYEVGDPQ